jgi:hypothetical protein
VNEGDASLVEIEELTWTTNAEVTPATKIYTWFTAPAVQSIEIAADGSSVLKYIYPRKQYNFIVNWVVWADTQWSSANMKYFYEETVHLNWEAKTWYTWLFWSWLPEWVANEQQTSFTMPASTV